MSSRTQQVVETPAVPKLRHRIVEIAGIALYAAGTLTLGWWLSSHVVWTSPLHLLAVVTALLAGWLVSDFTSGFVHWLGDTFGDEQMPVLGQAFIRPFREHHFDPKDITRHDFVETNGNNCVIVIVLLTAPILALHYGSSAGWSRWLQGVLWMLGFATFMTNQIHSWAHADEVPALVSWLQELGIFMSPEHHDTHHTAPYDTYYCITCGWLNPLLDKTRFFPRLERLIRRVGRT